MPGGWRPPKKYLRYQPRKARKPQAVRRGDESAMFQRMVEQSPDVLFRFEFQPKRRYAYMSPSIQGMVGYTPEDFYRQPTMVIHIAHPDDRPILEKLQRGEAIDPYFQMRWIHKDGRVILTEQHIRLEWDSAGVLQAVEGICRDITDRFSIEDTLTKLVYSSPVAMVISSMTDRRILAVNDGFLDMLSFERSEVIGHSSFDLKLWAKPEQREEIVQSLLRGLECKNQEILLRTRDGRLLSGLATMELIQYSGIQGLLAMIVDITERKQRMNELQAIAALTGALRSALTYEEIYPIILDQFQTLLGSDALGLSLVEPRAQTLVMKLARGAWAGWAGQDLRKITTNELFTRLHDQPYLNNQAEELDGSLVQDFRAIACIPLASEGQVLGNLWVGRKTPISEDELQIMLGIGQIAANAIHRANLHELTEIHLQRLTTLRAIDQAISASLDLKLTLNILITQITAQLHIDAAGVMLYDPYLHILKTSLIRGVETSEFTSARLRLGQSSAGRIAVNRELEYVTDPRLLEPNLQKKMRAEGFVTYIGVPLIAKGKIKGILQLFHHEKIDPDPDWLDFLNALGTQAAIAIDTAELFEQLQRSNTSLKLASDGAIEALSRVMELHDHEPPGHTRTLANLTLRLGEALGVDRDELVHIQRGVFLHDIGKLGISDQILHKPGSLSPEEWEIMHRHPLESRQLLERIADFRPALEIPVYHHEKWDGSGYPSGLKGSSIPLSARIFAVVDVWDALCSARPFRPAWTQEDALAYICSQSGAHFDPAIVQAFLQILKEA